MKEFENWNYIHYINDLRISNEITAKHRKQERNKGWKAALRCVRDKMLPNCHEPMDIYDFIEEELSC